MDAGTDIARHSTGIGGVAVAALLSAKEGWRPVVLKAAAGLVMVFMLGHTAAQWLGTFSVPPEAAGFLLGGFGVQVFKKAADLVQELNLAWLPTALIEKWTGAKAPAKGGEQ